MPKRIILLSDGTGNAASSLWRTNVWRLFEALDLSKPDQVACYDDGVGTSAFKPLAILGGAFGWGLKRNVIRLYEFLCRNYKSDDTDIFAFGFSRGAFTVRVLMGFVASQGLVPFTTEAELHRNAELAFRAYRREKYHVWWRPGNLVRWPLESLRLLIELALRLNVSYDRSKNREIKSIRFIGVWDTVAAYGLPMDEMTRGVSLFLWPLELPDRFLSDKVQRACHALALDDERTTFHPVLWSEEREKVLSPASPPNIREERISQVWFVGAHANVGGGYPDDSLAHVALNWMAQQAALCGLAFKRPPEADPDALVAIRSSQDRDGRLYDSRAGLGGYYRYGPRKIAELSDMQFAISRKNSVKLRTAKIHESVLQRRANGAHVYAPVGLPEHYALVRDDGTIVEPQNNQYESPDDSKGRAIQQERVWNWIWLRRFVYFATVAASAHLVLFPLIHQVNRSNEFSTTLRPLSEIMRLTGGFLPGIADWWIDSFATNPKTFTSGVGLLILTLWLGSWLQAKVTGDMNMVWRAGATNPSAISLAHRVVYGFRTWSVYRALIYLGRRYVLPVLWAAAFVYYGLALASHLSFNILDALGTFCNKSPIAHRLQINESRETSLNANALCSATGVQLEEGYRYSVTITQTTPWRDDGYESGVSGFEISELPTWHQRVGMFVFLPLRRVFLRPWFRPIARIGAKGTDEYFIDPENRVGLRDPQNREVNSVFRARRDGELFLYLNEATIGVPQIADYFYRNNSGEASVEIKRLSNR